MNYKSLLTSGAIVLSWLLFLTVYLVTALGEIKGQNASLPETEPTRASVDHEAPTAAPAHDRAAATSTPAGDTLPPPETGLVTAAPLPEVGSLTPYFVCIDNYPNWSVELAGAAAVRLPVADLEAQSALLAETGTQVIAVLEMLQTPLDVQLTWLQAAAASGVTIAAIELGDTEYRPTPENRAAFATPADYGATVISWSAALRAAFPDAAILATSAPPYETNQRIQNWNNMVNPAVSESQAGYAVDFFVDSGIQQETVFSDTLVTQVLGQPWLAWDRYQNFALNSLATMPAGTPVTFSSWFLDSGGAAIAGTWAESLVQTAQYLLLAEDERLLAVCSGRVENPANRLALQQTAQAMAFMTTTQRLEFTGIDPVFMPGGGVYQPVLGRMFGSGPARTGLLVNLSADVVTIQIVNTGALPEHFTALRANPIMPVDAGQNVVRVPGNVGTGRITLPPYAIVRLHS